MKRLGLLNMFICGWAMVSSAQLIGLTTASDKALGDQLKQVEALPKEQRSPVLMIGDSMMRLLGNALEKELGKIPDVKASSFTSLGSGLARLDAFDWMAKSIALMDEKKPSTVIVSLGANDHQVLVDLTGKKILVDTPAWSQEYGRRISQIMGLLIQGGAKRIIWLTLPDMKDPTHQRYAQTVNKIVAEQAATHPAVTLFDTAPILARKQGKFVSYVMGADGSVITVRDPDGIHLSTDGAKRLAQALALAYWK
ncbi:MAG: DUF459 domain-containing protein [bacterium]